MEQSFKTCGSCRFVWESWEAFLADDRVRLLGLQALPRVPEASVIVFEHSCGSSVSVLSRRLEHLLATPADASLTSLRGTSECALHCFSLSDHSPCDRPCSHRRDREILAIVENEKRRQQGYLP